MPAFSEQLSHFQRRIEEELQIRLPAVDTPPAKLHEAMRYSVFSGGKRLRPALCVASAEAVGGSVEDALLPAIAVEALHTYTLVHDDLPSMDDDDLRRGKPTSHRKFGEATAILAGDALLTIAFEWLGKTNNSQLVIELAQATGSIGTVGGQIFDIAIADDEADRDLIREVHRMKTADLIAVSVRMGALAGGATEEQIAVVNMYGHHLGMAFQLIDDVQDEEPSTMKAYGKNAAILEARDHMRKAEAALGIGNLHKSMLGGFITYVLDSIPKQMEVTS